MISIQNLVKKFGNKTVLKDIDLEIENGEVVVLIGRSGSGKTTLLRTMNALEIPTSGTVTVDGVSYTADDKRSQVAVRKKTGMVFQNFQLFPHMTALENVMEGLIQVKQMSKDEAEKVAINLLEKVDLLHVKDQYPISLSGGQQQRVGIARALAMNPKVMLFDEPTSALDPELVQDVLKVIKGLRDEGMTMVIVTHEMAFARSVADKVAFIHDGRIEEIDHPEVIFTKPKSEHLQKFLNIISI